MLVGRRVLRFGFTNMLWAIGVSSAGPAEARRRELCDVLAVRTAMPAESICLLDAVLARSAHHFVRVLRIRPCGGPLSLCRMTSPWRQSAQQAAFAPLNERCQRYHWFDPTTAQANKGESDRSAPVTVASQKKEPSRFVVRPIQLKSPNGCRRTFGRHDA